jgi:Protein of unknown function (DUF1657)
LHVINFINRKKDLDMTVGTQVKQALAGLKSAQASFETFALATDNQNAKKLYQDAAQQTQSVLDSLEPRLQEILAEEPQYNQ